MANVRFDVNTNAVIALTAKLERLNRQGLPNAIRSTLNDAAFVSKKSNILDSAKRNMTVRNPSFFRKFTGVNKATGYNVNSMYSEVGFVNTDPDKKKGRKAIEGMQSNEVGGTDTQGAMYLKKARVSGSAKRLVRRGARFAKSNLAKSRQGSGKGKKAGFMSNVVASLEENKPVFIKSKKGTFLVQVTKISSKRKGKKLDIKMIWLMRSRRTNAAHAKATHFVEEAAKKTQKQMEVFFAKNAQREFDKVLKKTI